MDIELKQQFCGNAYQIRNTVSILVLMDIELKLDYYFTVCFSLAGVSILVLMDIELKLRKNSGGI